MAQNQDGQIKGATERSEQSLQGNCKIFKKKQSHRVTQAERRSLYLVMFHLHMEEMKTDELLSSKTRHRIHINTLPKICDDPQLNITNKIPTNIYQIYLSAIEK